MIVCVCHRVSDRDINRAVRDGCTSFDALQAELGVSTACGCCERCARDTLQCQLALRPEQAAAGPGQRPVVWLAPPKPGWPVAPA